MSDIWAPKMPNTGHACTKIQCGVFEISISMDDSCGGMPVYGRSDIRVFTRRHDLKDVDVTHLFVPEYSATHLVVATTPTLFMIMARALTDPPEISDVVGKAVWSCVYCGKDLPDQHSACCGEVGHTEVYPTEINGGRT